jgi:hypothetical protein
MLIKNEIPIKNITLKTAFNNLLLLIYKKISKNPN